MAKKKLTKGELTTELAKASQNILGGGCGASDISRYLEAKVNGWKVNLPSSSIPVKSEKEALEKFEQNLKFIKCYVNYAEMYLNQIKKS